MKGLDREVRVEIASLALCTLSLLYFIPAAYFATGLTAAWLSEGKIVILDGVTLDGRGMMAAVGCIALPGFILLIVGTSLRWLLGWDEMP